MSHAAIEILVLGLLVLANGVFAMAEIALISVRRARFRTLAQQGDVRARAALDLVESPSRFLSTVQVGITLIGVLAGAFGGATLARDIAGALQTVTMLAPYGEAIGIAVVVAGITLLLVWLDAADPDDVNWRKIVDSGHSYFPVFQNQRDRVLGLVSVKSLGASLALRRGARLRDMLVPPLVVPVSMGALKLLEAFKPTRKHVALVTDEFSNVQGLITHVDVLEKLVGEFPAYEEPQPARVLLREDGSWLADGALEIEEPKRQLAIDELPGEAEDHLLTLGGFVLAQLQRIPREGDHFKSCGHRFEVADMDDRRMDKVVVGHRPTPPDAQLSITSETTAV